MKQDINETFKDTFLLLIGFFASGFQWVLDHHDFILGIISFLVAVSSFLMHYFYLNKKKTQENDLYIIQKKKIELEIKELTKKK